MPKPLLSSRWSRTFVALSPLVLNAACGFGFGDDEDDPPGAATDTQGDPNLGWEFRCQNFGPSENKNYYHKYEKKLCEGEDSGPDEIGCWGAFVPKGIDTCVNATNVPGFDPSNWTAYENGIRAACSATCASKNGGGDPAPADDPPPAPKCDDADWSAVAYPKNANGPDPAMSDCELSSYGFLESDPYGGSIVWPGGTSITSPCNLYDGECEDEFDALVFPFVSHLYPIGDITISDRRANRLATSTTSKVTFYAATGNKVLPLDATVEYSTGSCSGAGCPFYLANVEAVQTGGPLQVAIPHEGSVLNKTLTDFEVDLVHSAFGLENRSEGRLALTPGTLQLQVSFTLTNTDGNTTGDGSFVETIVNDEMVFGTKTSTGVTAVVIEREFIPGVSARIELDNADDVEFEPTVSDTLPKGLKCERLQSAVPLRSYISASDPDGDLDVSGWIVDGSKLYAADVSLGNGTYDIAAIAIDTRGAIDVGPTKTLTISGCL